MPNPNTGTTAPATGTTTAPAGGRNANTNQTRSNDAGSGGRTNNTCPSPSVVMTNHNYGGNSGGGQGLTWAVVAILGIIAFVFLAVFFTRTFTGGEETRITTGASPAVPAPTAPMQRQAVREDEPVKVFEPRRPGDVKQAPEGNNFNREKCFNWYDDQHVSYREYWDEEAKTCK